MPWSSDICISAIHQERSGQTFTVAPHELEQGASVLFGLVQDSLYWMREFGYGRQAERSLIELWTLQQLVVEAVAAVCPGGRRTAKRLQIDAAGDTPLTVCVGYLSPTRLPDLRDVLDPNGDFEEYKIPTIAWNTRGSGCLRICAESTGMRRPDFRRWCEGCGSRSTWREQARLAAIEGNWKGSPSYLTWSEGRRFRVWPRTCARCGKPFKSTVAQRRVCHACRPSRTSLG
jgi:hypothetical protein